MNGFLKKAGLGVALAATALTAAAPADAQRWGGRYRPYYHHGGEGAAGALVGGIIGLGIGAAIASSNRPRYYYDAPPPPPPPAYYYERPYYNYYPRCYTSWRWDPDWGREEPVRVCR